MNLSEQTIRLLEDIERRIDPDAEEDFSRQWENFLYNKFDDEIFIPKRKVRNAAGISFPKININDAINDYECMLLSQLYNVSEQLESETLNLCVRANYGTGIMPSLFGAEIFEMAREADTLPTTRPLDDTDKIRALVEKGAPDLMNGFGRRVFEFGELCKEVFSKYPKIQKYVEVYHPDVQGPLDVCELLWGCEMFYSMYDEPELVHGMLRLITDTYIRVLDKWYEMFPSNSHMNCHWGIIRHRGTILLRNDSAMNLSPAFYREYAAPYDGELLQHYDGGAVHFCGRGDHYMDILCDLPKLYGINMSQPELNDMEKIYRCTLDKGIKLLAFSPEYAAKDRSRVGGFGGNMHCSEMLEKEDTAPREIKM